MNGVMQSETEMILAARAGMDTNRSPRFAKMKETIASGVSYLEARANLFKPATYSTFHLVSMLDHLHLFNVVEPARIATPKLSAIVDRMYKESPIYNDTAPPPLQE
jgi:hypothetical protein